MKSKITLRNVVSYIQGTLRYKAFYSNWFSWIIRPHIFEQIQVRIMVMDKECYNSGACKLCGCSTTALQMANKACDKPCYPKMMSKSRWKAFKRGTIVHDVKGRRIWLYENENRLKSFKLDDYVGKSNHRFGEYPRKK